MSKHRTAKRAQASAARQKSGHGTKATMGAKRSASKWDNIPDGYHQTVKGNFIRSIPKPVRIQRTQNKGA